MLGRLDEAISTGGLTVVPQVVEAALGAHPLVAECAVFGVPDDRLGQRVAAAVVPSAAEPRPWKIYGSMSPRRWTARRHRASYTCLTNSPVAVSGNWTAVHLSNASLDLKLT